MTAKDWRNLAVVALAVALCFGGSFTCSTNFDSDRKPNGQVSGSAIPH